MVLINFPGSPDSVRERIVLASVCPSCWPLVLQCIEDLFPHSIARLERMASRDIAVARVDRGLRARGARVQRVAAAPRIGTVVKLDPADLPEPTAPMDGAGLVVEVDGDVAILLTLRFPPALGQHYHAAVAALLRRLREDLTLSLRATRNLQNGRDTDRSAVEAGWDRLAAGVTLLSSRLRVQIANAAMDDLLADRRFFLPPVAGVLQPAVKADAARLREAAERLIDGDSEGESLALTALRGPQRLLVRLHRLEGPPGADAAQPAAARLIAIIEPEGDGGSATAAPLAPTLASLRFEAAQATAPQSNLCWA